MGKRARKNSDEEESYDPNSDSEIVDEEDEKDKNDPEMSRAKAEEEDYIMSNQDEESIKEKEPQKLKSSKKEAPVASVKKDPQPKPKKDQNPDALDLTYDINKNYFYQNVPPKEWEEIKAFIQSYISAKKTDEESIKTFLSQHPNISKGANNSERLLSIINELAKENSTLPSYKILINTFISLYMKAKPSVLDCYFFPNPSNEIYVVNMLRTCKKTLDVAIFTLTNNKICAAIIEAFNRGVTVRVIADDECCKMWGSDVGILAAAGIPCKTDNAIKYHMHHKFAILDNSVVVTGSFNWTGQAVKYNQENILFYENKEIAQRYTDEFNRLWNTFTTVIDQEESKKKIAEEAEKKKLEKERRLKEKEKKDAIKAKEKAKKDAIKAKEKEKLQKEKEKEKLRKQKEKEKLKMQKEKEKAKAKKKVAKK